MRSLLRQFRRAPGRVITSVLALALAVGAIGVLAIPTVSEGTLHQLAAEDGLADIVVTTSPLSPDQLHRVAGIDGVTAAEGAIDRAVRLADGRHARLVGLDIGPDQTINRLHLDAGALPRQHGEVVTSADLAPVGAQVEIGGVSLTVVGHGGTIWWSGSTALFTDLDTAAMVTGLAGTNTLAITAADDDIDSLRSIAASMRSALTDEGARFVDFPSFLPDGSTPIDADIAQVSQLIGMLGVVAGIVALVLLASTTNTLISERTREVAVMRALGAQSRPLRRRLRAIAVVIAAASLLIGLPLGIVIANVIARLVLEQFVGITPALAWSWPVVAGSAVFALVGARLVAARAARRVTGVALAEALRDREGAPYGRRWSERALAHLRLGSLQTRLATRASLHQRARATAVVLQIAAAVGAVVVIIGLTMSVNRYNGSVDAPWRWESLTRAEDPGLPFAVDTVSEADGAEAGVWTTGEVDGWDMDVFGLRPGTELFHPQLRDGRTIRAGSHEALVSAGFVARTDVRVGDEMLLELASGPARYLVVGTVEDGGRSVYVDRADVATDLGAPGMANTVWSADASPTMLLDVGTRTSTAGELATEDEAARHAIVLIFGSIAGVVAGVAALAVASTMAVNLYERRHALAAMRALGAGQRDLRKVVRRELLGLAALGLALGVVGGWFGTKGIIASFEASNAVDIGTVFAVSAVPVIALATLAAVSVLASLAVRSASSRSIAVTLRGAA